MEVSGDVYFLFFEGYISNTSQNMLHWMVGWYVSSELERVLMEAAMR